MRLHARSGQATDNILTTYPTLTTPQDDLANLRGINIFGTWKLTIRDMGVGDIGTFNSWQLNLFYSNVILDTTSRSTSPETSGTVSVLPSNPSLVTKTNFPLLQIPDLRTVSDIISITEVGQLTSIIIDVDITHSYIGDLRLRLIAPDNSSVLLHNEGGGSADDIKTSYPILSSSFGDLNILNGKSINGNWILTVSDVANQDQGRVNSWGLKLYYRNANLVLDRQRTVGSNVLDMRTVNDTVFLTESGRIASIIVRINITHTYIGDLVVRLFSPDNTVVFLHNRSGGSSVNLQTSYFSTSSATSLNLLNGKSITGAWTLSVSDQATGDQGVFNSWSFSINYLS